MTNDDEPEGHPMNDSPPLGPTGSSPPTAEDVAISRAKREAAAATIRAIREAGQERIAARFRRHLDAHGEEHETSAEDFLKEASGNQPPDD